MTNNDFSLFSGFDGVSKVCLIGPQVESKTQKAISVFNREIQNKAPGAKKSQVLEKSEISGPKIQQILFSLM